MRGESDAHRRLKKLALCWAIDNGYRIAAAEVSIPNFRCRVDAAAYRPRQWARKVNSVGAHVPVGTTAIFECKQSRGDFLKDSKLVQATTSRLEKLHERKLEYEKFLLRQLPSLRNGDSLFQEFETCDLESIEYQPYEKVMREIKSQSARLHTNTKFDRITTRRPANLHYVVADADVAKPHELPFGWGLLIRDGEQLRVTVKPSWLDLPAEDQLFLLQRIALAGTRAVRHLNEKIGSTR